MGVIVRHAGAPYANPEELDGTNDIEVDFSNFYTEFNGRIDDVNIKVGAVVAGSKFADESINGQKLSADTVTLAKYTTGAVERHGSDTSTTGTWPDSGGDFTGVDSVTKNIVSGNFVMLDFSVTVTPSSAVRRIPQIKWSIDGTEHDASFGVQRQTTDSYICVATYGFVVSNIIAANSGTGTPVVASGSTEMKPVGYVGVGLGADLDITHAMFSVAILTGK